MLFACNENKNKKKENEPIKDDETAPLGCEEN
jgi:hypothetical protein